MSPNGLCHSKVISLSVILVAFKFDTLSGCNRSCLSSGLDTCPPDTVHKVMLYSLPGTEMGISLLISGFFVRSLFKGLPKSTKVTFLSGSCAAFSIIGMFASDNSNLEQNEIGEQHVNTCNFVWQESIKNLIRYLQLVKESLLRNFLHKEMQYA